MKSYQRKRPDGWTDKDWRMRRAVQHRAEGKSLRQIAAEMSVSYMTVSRDLARWDREHIPAADSNVVPLSRKLSQRAVTSRPGVQGGGEIVTGGCDSLPTTGDVMGLSASEARIARAVACLTGRGAS
ncbi:MAG TPA: helix-turn-helix domain-containing protein [Streptosporangiaceae bacterium]|nr:helix-turn-helix domain-containing protein [Streptosporangiaceae bacterium]